MIACYAWTNTQIINVTNAKVNLYAGEEADLYVRMGGHISAGLIGRIKSSKVFRNVFCIDPIGINYNKLRFGRIKNVRALFLKEAYRSAYGALLNSICPEQKYDRVLMTWFITDNLFLLDYWSKYSDNFRITFVEEGTGTYCYHKKEILFPLTLFNTFSEKLKHYLTEYTLAKKFARCVDSICLYKPEYCRPDMDFRKMVLPPIKMESNPVVYDILCGSADELDSTHYIRYNKRQVFYFSSYSMTEGKAFENQSMKILTSAIDALGAGRIIAKVHTHRTSHADSFAKSIANEIFVDRERYIFEGLYSQLDEPDKKVFISCISTAAIYPKFMFDHEPYVIFTYRLYDTYRQCGVERDDWMAEAVRDAYTDKSRVMIPNSFDEFKSMLHIAIEGTAKEYDIPKEFVEFEEE